jgi:hypothetical protein
MWVPLIVGGALWLKDRIATAPAPAPASAAPAAPPPAPRVAPDVQYYLTNESMLRAQDMMANRGMSADEAARQAASDVVDEYRTKNATAPDIDW